MDVVESLEDADAESTAEAARSAVDGDQRPLLALAGGAALGLSALRSLTRGDLRAIPYGAGAAVAIRWGLRNRRSSESGTFEPSTDAVEGGTEGKDISDEAATATGSPENVDVDDTGDIPDEADLEEGGGGSRIEFTQDEPGDREVPHDATGLDGEADDPRRDDDGDGPVEIDLSQSAMAEEASEAAGPSPEQSQPTQTDAVEPEETPDEDADERMVDPEDDGVDENDEADEDDDETNA